MMMDDAGRRWVMCRVVMRWRWLLLLLLLLLLVLLLLGVVGTVTGDVAVASGVAGWC